MKLYGSKRQDRGCCPGHDKFPPDKYASRRSDKAHRKATRTAHQIGRARRKAETRREMDAFVRL